MNDSSISIYTGQFSRTANFMFLYLELCRTAPISISLPLREEPFSQDETRCFFESVLPEGYSRRAVADWVKTDERDYLTILSALGRECLGAIKVIEDNASCEAHYEKLCKKKTDIHLLMSTA